LANLPDFDIRDVSAYAPCTPCGLNRPDAASLVKNRSRRNDEFGGRQILQLLPGKNLEENETKTGRRLKSSPGGGVVKGGH
jgi:hypothetical protein